MNEQRDRPCLLVLITFFFLFRENANSGESFMNGKVGICLNPMVQLEFGCCTFHFPCLRSIQSYFVKPTGFFFFSGVTCGMLLCNCSLLSTLLQLPEGGSMTSVTLQVNN